MANVSNSDVHSQVTTVSWSSARPITSPALILPFRLARAASTASSALIFFHLLFERSSYHHSTAFSMIPTKRSAPCMFSTGRRSSHPTRPSTFLTRSLKRLRPRHMTSALRTSRRSCESPSVLASFDSSSAHTYESQRLDIVHDCNQR
jgi:hypothetical protein